MNNSFSPQTVELIRRHMQTGKYRTEEELVVDALEALELVDPEEDEELRAEIAVRLKELETDEGEPLDVDAAIARLEARMKSTNGA